MRITIVLIFQKTNMDTVSNNKSLIVNRGLVNHNDQVQSTETAHYKSQNHRHSAEKVRLGAHSGR